MKKILGAGLIVLLLGLEALTIGVRNFPLLVDPRHITPVSPMYGVKRLREILQSQFIFGDQDQAGWDITLASKRIEEARTLQGHNLSVQKDRQLKLARNNQAEAKVLIEKLKSNTNVDFLVTSYDQNEAAIKEIP